MKPKITCLGLALLLCALHVGRAQEPKPEDILRRVGEVYKGLSSYRDTATMKMQMKMMGMDISMDMSAALAMVKPNKVNLSFKMNMMGMSNDLRVVSDGKKLWTHMSAGNQYTEADAPPNLSGAALQKIGGAANMMGPSPNTMGGVYEILMAEDPQKALADKAKNAKLVGSEDLAGKSTYVLTWEEKLPEMGQEQQAVPLPLPDLKDLAFPVKVWVSQEEGLILQMAMDMSPMFRALFAAFGEIGAPPGGVDKQQQEQFKEQFKAMLKDMQMTLTMTHKDIQLNAPIPDETFTFQPPAGAKRVDQLDMGAMMRGMGLPFPGMEEKPAASPWVGKPAPDFVLKDRTGKTVRLSQFRGKPVLLNFWAEF